MNHSGDAEVAKRHVRAAARARRRAIGVSASDAAAAGVAAELLRRVPPMARIASFVPMGDEIDISTANKHWLATDGLILPRVEGRNLVMVEVGPGTSFQRSGFGVLEPLGPSVDPDSIDVVVVPGLAFDLAGSRLGYGGGFYDRWLPTAMRACTIGVAFDDQLVHDLPIDPWDRPMDVVITERRTMCWSRGP
ncbi:MAG: 5-formyltetrahydrofolate cyclo-ligase [Ilumatobacteraceae bacterium]